MPTLLPIFLDLSAQSILVVGAGPAAVEKIEKLIATGASIHVIARTIPLPLRSWLEEHAIPWIERSFHEEDVRGHFLVISAVEHAATHRSIAAAARLNRVLVNTVDAPAHCDFYFGAQVQRGPLQIAISTHGLFPGVARALRLWLEETLPPSITADLDDLVALRRQVQARIPDPQTRMRALKDQLHIWLHKTDHLTRGFG